MYRLVPPTEILTIPFQYGHITEAEKAARRVYMILERRWAQLAVERSVREFQASMAREAEDVARTAWKQHTGRERKR
jgi:hypothetical protein